MVTDDVVRPVESYQPHYIGPTFARDENGAFILPRRSLGWGCIRWAIENLTALGDTTKPLQLTPEQMRFLLWWYAVDETGDWLYKDGVLQRLKGWGKDPLAAVLCMIEANGPCEFSHFTAAGSAVGKQRNQASIVVVGVAEQQTANLAMNIPSILPDRTKEKYGIADGAKIIRSRNGLSEIRMVANSSKALEGRPSNFVVMDETHHWDDSNKGHHLASTARNNATKVNGRTLSITNAFQPGEDSVAERMRSARDAYANGELERYDTLYDSIEAPADLPMDEAHLTHMITLCRGDSYWLPVDRAVASVLDVTQDVARSRRFWLNQIVSVEDSLYRAEEVGAFIATTDDRLLATDEIVLGFDGSKSDDSTALIAIRIADRKAFVVGLWENVNHSKDWKVDVGAVEREVRHVFDNYTVRAFFADVAGWESKIKEWEVRYSKRLHAHAKGSAIAWDMRGAQTATRAHELCRDALLEGRLVLNPDNGLKRHILNARRKDTTHGIYFTKEHRESRHKVDAYAALVLAHEALVQFELMKKKPKGPTRFYKT